MPRFLSAGGLVLVTLALSAVSASTAGAETIEFRSEAQHTALVGSATSDQVLTAGGIELRCEEAAFAGTFESEFKSTDEIALAPAYGKCKLIEGETTVVADVDAGGCFYTLKLVTVTAAGGPFDGPVELECEEPEEAIEVTATLFGNEYACMEIPPQAPGGAASHALEGTGKTAQLAISASLSALDYTLEGICGETEAENGSYAGGLELVGEDEEEEQVGIRIRPRAQFHSGSDTTTLTAEASGAQLLETGGGLKLECGEASLEGTTAGTSQPELTAHPAYGECSLSVPEVGSFNAKVEPKSCHYALVAEGKVETQGEARIECESEADAIEVRAEFVPPFFAKCLLIPAQAPESAVDYTNEGSVSTRSIAVDTSLEGVEYTLEGACGEEALADASFEGEVSVSGEDGEEDHVGVWVGRLGKFVSGSDETILTAEALSTQEFTSAGGVSFGCAGFSVTGGTITTAQDTIVVSPAYSQCIALIPGAGSRPAYVDMNGCTYVLGESEGLSIQCPVGNVIRVTAEIIAPFKSNCIDISGHVPDSPDLDYSNSGAGSTMSMVVESTVEGIEYQLKGPCGSTTLTDMEYTGAISMTGDDAVTGEHIPVTWE